MLLPDRPAAGPRSGPVPPGSPGRLSGATGARGWSWAMLGQELSIVLVLAAAMALGGFVKGVTGIGLPVVSMAILSSIVDVRLALGLVTIPIVLTNLWQAYQAGRPMETIRRFWLLILCMLVCIWLGTTLVVRLPAEALYGIIGAAVVIFTVTSHFTPHWTLPERTGRWVGPLAGILSGLLGGISAIWGPPLVTYFIMIRLPKEVFIRTTGVIWLAASIPLAGGYLRNGILDAEMVPLSPRRSPPASPASGSGSGCAAVSIRRPSARSCSSSSSSSAST